MKYEHKITDGNIKVFKNDELIANIKKDLFNTETFGLEMANVELLKGNVDVEEIINISKENKIEHLTISISVDSIDNIHSALNSGFLLVDTLVTYLFDFKKITLKEMNHFVDLRYAKDSDIPILKDIAYNSFVIDRFHSDPSLDKDKANEYYAKWIENSINGYAKETIVAVLNDEPIGFTTIGNIAVEDGIKVGRMVLSAVSPKARGKRAYTSMIHEGLRYLYEKVDRVYVGTQVNNYPVQKTWINLNGYIFESKHVLQKKIS